MMCLLDVSMRMGMSKPLIFTLALIGGLVLGILLLFTPIVSYPVIPIVLVVSIITVGVVFDTHGEVGFCTGLILSAVVAILLLVDMSSVIG